MVRIRRGRKARKADRQDKFYAEWAAHEAARKEEERDFDPFEEEIKEPEHETRIVVRIIA